MKMWLKSLKLLQFKNYSESQLDFIQGVNVFSGNNGAGKTNILDAIHYLCMCKSYFNPIDSQQIRTDAEYFMVQGIFEKEQQDFDLICSLKKNHKKVFKKNKKEYDKFSEHIGLFPMVMITPYDANIILDGSEERRKFLDTIISQTDKLYLDCLISYNKHLNSRNSLLKQFKNQRISDDVLLGVYDEQLVHFGNLIFHKRQEFLNKFIPLFNKHYENLCDTAERVDLKYQSPLNQQSFEEILIENKQKDFLLERTCSGIHKDDLVFTIHEMPLKKFGSQGQQKSFLIALKLAQYTYIQHHMQIHPLLLLDDIFDKLDQHRVHKLMEMVAQNHFGQIFITDTDAERVNTIFKSINIDIQLFKIEKGASYVI